MGRVKGFRLEGVLPAVVTPFDKHEMFEESAFRSLIDWLIDQGITGIVPCGTTGEFSLMSQEERARVIEVCVDQVNGRIPVIAQNAGLPPRIERHRRRAPKNLPLLAPRGYL